jgi:hypothetical protein
MDIQVGDRQVIDLLRAQISEIWLNAEGVSNKVVEEGDPLWTGALESVRKLREKMEMLLAENLQLCSDKKVE